MLCWREPSQCTLRLRLQCPGSDGVGTTGHWGRRGRDHGASVTPGHGAAVIMPSLTCTCSSVLLIQYVPAVNICWWLIQTVLADSILTSQSSSDLSMYSLHLSHLWVCASISLSYYPLSIFSRYQTNISISYLGHVLRFQAVCTNRAGYPLQMFSYFLHSMSSVLSNKSQKLSMECLNNIVSSPQ